MGRCPAAPRQGVHVRTRALTARARRYAHLNPPRITARSYAPRSDVRLLTFVRSLARRKLHVRHQGARGLGRVAGDGLLEIAFLMVSDELDPVRATPAPQPHARTDRSLHLSPQRSLASRAARWRGCAAAAARSVRSPATGLASLACVGRLCAISRSAAHSWTSTRARRVDLVDIDPFSAAVDASRRSRRLAACKPTPGVSRAASSPGVLRRVGKTSGRPREAAVRCRTLSRRVDVSRRLSDGCTCAHEVYAWCVFCNLSG
jgi:hypothetical protein